MKKVLSISIVLSLFLAFGNLALAKNDKKFAPSSEEAVESGVYDVEGQSNMKVRVFVHKEKARPGPAPSDSVCGLGDLGSEAVVSAGGWKLPSLVSYRINASSVPAQFRSSANTIVDNSFRVWESALGSDSPAISLVGNTTLSSARFDGQNIIAWGRTSGSVLGVTYIWWYTDTGVVAEVDTIMNNKFSWQWSNPSLWPAEAEKTCAYTNVYDAQNILTHELGHWFGLKDHYTAEYQNNTMFGFGSSGETKKDTLSSGDILGVQAIHQ